MGKLAKPRLELATDMANPADERRQSLVHAAFEAIAADGFEGLRTRSVAIRTGVNVATLHYYFPTKEALIGGVAQYLAEQFISLHGPPPASSGSDALDRLRQEFSDVRFYREQNPDLIVVMLELQLRARRDKSIARIIDPLLGHFRGGLEAVVRAGIREGAFRADLDPMVGAALLALTISGTATGPVSTKELDRVFQEIERWLAASPSETKRKRKGKGKK